VSIAATAAMTDQGDGVRMLAMGCQLCRLTGSPGATSAGCCRSKEQAWGWYGSAYTVHAQCTVADGVQQDSRQQQQEQVFHGSR
jgi:hypothetical protein